MTQLPATAYGSGYSVPLVRQFSIFLENRVGRLVDVLRSFDEADDVGVHGLAVLEASDFAVVRFISDNADATRILLRERGTAFAEMDLIVCELAPDRGLSRLCQFLLGAELNIQFMYPLMGDHQDYGPRMAICCDDNVFAGQILLRKGFRLMGTDDLR